MTKVRFLFGMRWISCFIFLLVRGFDVVAFGGGGGLGFYDFCCFGASIVADDAVAEVEERDVEDEEGVDVDEREGDEDDEEEGMEICCCCWGLLLFSAGLGVKRFDSFVPGSCSRVVRSDFLCFRIGYAGCMVYCVWVLRIYHIVRPSEIVIWCMLLVLDW